MKNRQQGRRKAAILLASLDRHEAEALLAQMPAEQADAVREAIGNLGEIDPEEQHEVLEEFFRIGPLVPDREPSGLALDDPTVAQLSISAAPADSAQRHSSSFNVREEAVPTFRLLEDAPIKTLAGLLEREQPQTIAVVLSHLAPGRAAELLAGLPSLLQAEVARRLVDLEETNADVLREVERGLEAWFSEQSLNGQRRSAGMAALKQILSATDADTKENILANVAAHDRQLAAKLAPAASVSPLVFAELVQLDDAALAKVVRASDPQVLVLALTAATDELIHRVLAGLPGREAKSLRRALDHIGPMRLSDVEDAQHELAAVAQSLESSGQIRRSPRRLSVAA